MLVAQEGGHPGEVLFQEIQHLLKGLRTVGIEWLTLKGFQSLLGLALVLAALKDAPDAT